MTGSSLPPAPHPRPSVSTFLPSRLPGRLAGEARRPGAGRGRAAVRGGAGPRRGCSSFARSSPGMRGAWDGVGQGIEGRLSPRPQAMDEHAGHQGPLQLGMRRGRSPVHAAVHGGGGRCSGCAVHAAQQARVVEIRRGKHPLQCRVVPRLG